MGPLSFPSQAQRRLLAQVDNRFGGKPVVAYMRGGVRNPHVTITPCAPSVLPGKEYSLPQLLARTTSSRCDPESAAPHRHAPCAVTGPAWGCIVQDGENEAVRGVGILAAVSEWDADEDGNFKAF